MSDTGPDDLQRLGARLDAAERKRATGDQRPPPTQASIAFRFGTEMIAGLLVGGGMGWGLDWLFGHFGFHTKPWLMIVFFVLGAAAGIRGVMRAANELNAQMAAAPAAPSVKQDDEEN
ncbi:MAG TPA: AtpZ/AtpI family protein [Rhizomicrobium sp.]